MDLRNVVKRYSQGSCQLKTTERVFFNVIQISILFSQLANREHVKTHSLTTETRFSFFYDENMLIECASNSQDRCICTLAYSEIFFVLLKNSCSLADEPAC